MVTCKKIDSLLESFVDGDLALDLSQDIRDHVADCPDCRIKLQLAKDIAAELHCFPQQTCPDSVVQKVLARVQTRRKTVFGRLLPALSQVRPRYDLGFSLGFVLILVAFVSLSIYHPSLIFKDKRPHYTEEEIAQAKKDIYMALGYVNYATNRMQQIIEKEVVPQKVIRPLQKSLDAIHTNKEKGDTS
ncbi:MAG: zf-HC2 domain-containing protein [Gemmatimonadota bacterium]|nr:MAG: zf-HC2 domain-containing protein [Gemmatimonadota bacterium]